MILLARAYAVIASSLLASFRQPALKAMPLGKTGPRVADMLAPHTVLRIDNNIIDAIITRGQSGIDAPRDLAPTAQAASGSLFLA